MSGQPNINPLDQAKFRQQYLANLDLTIGLQQANFNANRILKSINQSDSVSNNINVLRTTNAFPGGIKLNHYFTSASYWFVRTNCPNGMQMFWAERPNFSQDNDFDTKNAKAAAYMLFSLGCTDPRSIFGSQ